MRPARFASLAALLAGVAASIAPADELTTTSGRKTTGKLVAVDAKGVTFQADNADARVAAKDVTLVDLGNKVATPGKGQEFDEIELTDGTILHCAKFLIKKRAVEPTFLPGTGGAPGPAVELPVGAVFTVMRRADDPKNRDDWKKMLAGRGKRDLYVIRQPDGLNFLQGTVLEGTETGEVVLFERDDGQRSPLRLSRATGGLVFNQPPQGVLPPTLCKVVDVFGNVLYAQAVDLDGAGGVRVKTVSGATFTYPSVKGVAKLDYSQGNVLYLSDLTPEVSGPDLDPLDPKTLWLKDKNLAFEPLRLDKTLYPKGLWLRDGVSLAFPVGGDYREFKALAGFDEGVDNTTAAVKLTVEADGRVLFTDVLRATDKPRPLNLDVKGAKQVRVVVESDHPFNGSQLVLADARVQK